jgi:hypothetical protein
LPNPLCVIGREVKIHSDAIGRKGRNRPKRPDRQHHRRQMWSAILSNRDRASRLRCRIEIVALEDQPRGALGRGGDRLYLERIANGFSVRAPAMMKARRTRIAATNSASRASRNRLHSRGWPAGTRRGAATRRQAQERSRQDRSAHPPASGSDRPRRSPEYPDRSRPGHAPQSCSSLL